MELIVQLEESILGGVLKQGSAFSGLWMLIIASTQALVYICQHLWSISDTKYY